MKTVLLIVILLILSVTNTTWYAVSPDDQNVYEITLQGCKFSPCLPNRGEVLVGEVGQAKHIVGSWAQEGQVIFFEGEPYGVLSGNILTTIWGINFIRQEDLK